MKINGDTNVARLLDEHPELLSVLVGISPSFKKLENRFLRKTIARRVKLSDAAKIAGVDLGHLIETLNAKIEPISTRSSEEPELNESEAFEDYSENFEYDDSQFQEILDVRGDIASNRDPLNRIMHAAKDIRVGNILVVINSFEPIPLYDVLGKKGFVHKTEKYGEDFKVLFKRVSAGETVQKEKGTYEVKATEVDQDEKVVEMDVRGLEPPEPMMRILKKLTTLETNEILLVHHHREPVFLYDKLEERGFTAVANKVGDNHYKIVIRRKSS
ncbi:MAG: DUF2249 domain-containing protein [Candidatus Kryptoniota bacterium]